MNKERFVYVTYIATTPSQVWKALTEPAAKARWPSG